PSSASLVELARPRSCALRRRRFSRSAAARRWLRPEVSFLSLSLPGLDMAALSAGPTAVQEAHSIGLCLLAFPCATGGRYGSFRRVASAGFRTRVFAAVAQW